MEAIDKVLPIPSDLDADIYNMLDRLRQGIYSRMQENKGIAKEEKKYKCELCKDTGIIEVSEHTARQCECVIRELDKKRYARADISRLFEHCVFDNYICNDDSCKNAKQIAIDFANVMKTKRNAKAIIFAGQVGSGKTHLAISILNELLKNKIECLYTNYKDIVRNLSQNAMDKELYANYINRLVKVDVLLIDDLFKCRNKSEITTAQLNYMYEIINSRYIDNKAIIITTEKKISELIEIDEAIGSRLFEMAGRRYIADMRSIKNYRLLKKEK